MPRGRKRLAVDQTLLEAALIGFGQMRRTIEEKIDDIRQRLGSNSTVKGAVSGRRRRTLSAAARRRIGAAQRNERKEVDQG